MRQFDNISLDENKSLLLRPSSLIKNCHWNPFLITYTSDICWQRSSHSATFYERFKPSTLTSAECKIVSKRRAIYFSRPCIILRNASERCIINFWAEPVCVFGRPGSLFTSLKSIALTKPAPPGSEYAAPNLEVDTLYSCERLLREESGRLGWVKRKCNTKHLTKSRQNFDVEFVLQRQCLSSYLSIVHFQMKEK